MQADIVTMQISRLSNSTAQMPVSSDGFSGTGNRI